MPLRAYASAAMVRFGHPLDPVAFAAQHGMDDNGREQTERAEPERRGNGERCPDATEHVHRQCADVPDETQNRRRQQQQVDSARRPAGAQHHQQQHRVQDNAGAQADQVQQRAKDHGGGHRIRL